MPAVYIVAVSLPAVSNLPLPPVRVPGDPPPAHVYAGMPRLYHVCTTSCSPFLYHVMFTTFIPRHVHHVYAGGRAASAGPHPLPYRPTCLLPQEEGSHVSKATVTRRANI